MEKKNKKIVRRKQKIIKKQAPNKIRIKPIEGGIEKRVKLSDTRDMGLILINNTDNRRTNKRSNRITNKKLAFSSSTKRILIILVLIILLSSILLFGMIKYKVKSIVVEGNIHYSYEEIVDMVTSGFLGKNSLYLTMKYKNKPIYGIPFVESMSVDIIASDSIRIVVYEKAIAGYVEHLGRYAYFDKDGIVVENSSIRTEGVPKVIGLEFDYVILHEALPAKESSIFERILQVTLLLERNQLVVDSIQFDDNGNMTLHFGDIRVRLGTQTTMVDKISYLKAILPSLEDKSGVVYMENYNLKDKSVTFDAD